MPAPNESDYLLLTREVLLASLELQTQIGALQLVIQKHTSITFEDIHAARSELESRKPQIAALKARIQALGFVDLLQALRSFEGPLQ